MPSTEYTKRVIIVCTAAKKDAANSLIEAGVEGAGPSTFNAPLYSENTKLAPITHYWCSWAMKPADFTRVQGLLADLESAGAITYYESHTPTQVKTERSFFETHIENF